MALKILKHSIDERYTKIGAEVARLCNWKHPNIVGFEGAWIFNNQVYIAMEYCSSGTLKDIQKQIKDFCHGFSCVAGYGSKRM